jgi:hypothetical protein
MIVCAIRFESFNSHLGDICISRYEVVLFGKFKFKIRLSREGGFWCGRLGHGGGRIPFANGTSVHIGAVVVAAARLAVALLGRT